MAANGAASISAQEITCQPPSVRESRAPSAYPIAAEMTAPSEQEVGELQRAAAFPQRKARDDCAAGERTCPEALRRALVRQPRAGHRRCERQQPDDDGAVRRGDVAHRICREQRETEDDTGGNQRERGQIPPDGATARALPRGRRPPAPPRSPRVPSPTNIGSSQATAYARRRQRQAERDYADEAPNHAAAAIPGASDGR